MEDDQQFCLRWNNHQSTLISVFDTLLENQTLVDCTLAAEGKFLKAHKVVLSACSPFFATLLHQQYDKHPIFILKDVKYQELRAMMDYMYRGEVNISQDQLAALLKAAESLQIKGLSDNRSGSTPKTEQHRGLSVPGSGSIGGGGGGGKLSGYTLEQTQSKRPRVGPSPMEAADISGSREGSSSPSRRRRKIRRRSVENAMSADVHDNSNSSQINQSSLQPQQQQQQPQSNAGLTGVGALAAATSSLPVSASALSTGSTGVLAATGSIVSTQGTTQQMTTNITKKTESVKGASDAMNSENMPTVGVVGTGDEQNIEHVKGEKSNHKQKSSGAGVVGKETAEMVIEPKSEYEEEGNEETVEDLTLDDEEMGMDDLDQNAGTSQAGEGSSQGYAPWQHDRSQDELLLAPQEAQQRDPQDLRTLYNIATAAAAAVAAASANSNAAKMHNNINIGNYNNNNNNSNNNNNNNTNNSNASYNKQRHSSISNERNECAKQNELLVAKSRLLTGLTADVATALPAYTPALALTSAATPPTQSPAPSVNKLLCDVLEPEISIRSMYKCCGKRFLQQAQGQQHQQQQQHLHIIQPHAMPCAALAAATISPPPPPPPPVATTTTTSALPMHASTTPSTPPSSSTHHSNCSGCQITAAASIQLANLIGSTMLLPQTAVAMQDVATKAATAGTTVNVTAEHNASKKLLVSNAEKLLCRGGNSTLEAVSSASASATSIVSPHAAAAAKKAANVQFHCEFCTFACSWKYDLKLHLRQKHGIHNKKM